MEIHRRPRRPDVRAWALTVVLTAGVVAIAIHLSGAEPLEAVPYESWLVLSVLMAAAERYRVHLHVARETHTFTLAELPTVLGMFFLSPVGVIAARMLGTTIALATVHARRPVKLAFNVASGSFEAAVAVLVFHAFVPFVGVDSSGTYGAALVAMASGSVVGIVMVWTIIRLVEGGRSLAELARSMRAGLPLAAANASIALFVVAIWRLRVELVWVALLPIAILAVTYRAYVGQWRHRDALDFLYDTAVETQKQPEPHSALLSVVRGVRAQLDANVAELVAIVDSGATEGAGGGRATVVSVGPGDAEEIRSMAVDDLPLEVRLRLADRAATDQLGPEEVWSLASGTATGPLILRLRGPIGDAVTFDDTDLEVVRSLARLAATALDRAQLAEVKAAFLSAVSHELRTPLTVVVGTAATLRARGSALPAEQQTELLARLDEQAHRLDRLLSDLLDLDRLNRGVLEPRRHLVDLVPLVDRAIHSMDLRGHTVEVGADALLAEVDPALAERIVENLVKNAVKYSPTGTSIVIDLQRRGDEVVISVEDEGHGIPAELRARLLEPFTRLDPNHPQPGTGIGLSLVRRFAQLHGGDAWIEEGRTGGTRVVVVLQDVQIRDDERRTAPLVAAVSA